MSAEFDIPADWRGGTEPPPPPVDDLRVEGLVNRFIDGKQAALFTTPDAFYRQQGADALAGAPAIAERLETLRTSILDRARTDGERAALGARLDLHVDDARDGIDRHLAAQRRVHNREVVAERQRLIRRAAELEPDNDDKIAGLAEAHASAAQELARMDGVAAGSPEEADILRAARSQILRAAIGERLLASKTAPALALFDRVKDALVPADRRALDPAIAVAADEAATDAWLAREGSREGEPLATRARLDDTLSEQQRLVVLMKIAARESAEESRRFAAVKGLDDRRDAAAVAIATQPSRYAVGTFARLANAYADNGAAAQAEEMRRLALWEPFLLPFAQGSIAGQQRNLEELTGPERAMAEAIVRHQEAAFARDPYAAGTALYPEVGPPLPDEDAQGRLKQMRIIEARRETSLARNDESSAVASDAVDEGLQPGQQYAQLGRNQTAPDTVSGISNRGRRGTAPIGEPLPGSRQLDAYIAANREAQRLKAEEKGQEEGRTTEPAPGSPEYRAAWQELRRLELEEAKGTTTEPPPGTEEHEAAKVQVPLILADEATRSPGESVFKDLPPNDPAIEKAFERWLGVYVTLKNGERIPDPSSPTGYVMAPFNDLEDVAAAGRAVGSEVLKTALTTLSKSEAEKKGRELVRHYLAQGGVFDYHASRLGFSQRRRL
jgi:hypothetical protein